ncbi:MAG: type II toxin-antitoxin system MqsA family antitoxin [Candidatus Aminicenantes bacterium]|nr:type II toxin-antitoxin system MqsA family antitoxin [Candidatus Aminicenantes bacterium]
MECVICKSGSAHPGVTDVVLQRGDTTIIFKNVPADVCKNCGEYYLDETVTEEILKRAEEAVIKGAEVEILKYIAA